jgi:anti-sigma B factor antagonist
MSETVAILTPRQRLQLSWRVNGGFRVLDIAGEVDAFTRDLLRECLMTAAVSDDGRGDSIVLNLAGVSFLDSAGLGVLVGAWRRMQAGEGILALAAPSRQVRRIFTITGLSRTFRIYDTEMQAVHACQRLASGAYGTLTIVGARPVGCRQAGPPEPGHGRQSLLLPAERLALAATARPARVGRSGKRAPTPRRLSVPFQPRQGPP